MSVTGTYLQPYKIMWKQFYVFMDVAQTLTMNLFILIPFQAQHILEIH